LHKTLIILSAGRKFKGDIERAVAYSRGDKKDDADGSPPVLIIESRPDDGKSDDDSDDTVRFADVAFHETFLLFD